MFMKWAPGLRGEFQDHPWGLGGRFFRGRGRSRWQPPSEPRRDRRRGRKRRPRKKFETFFLRKLRFVQKTRGAVGGNLPINICKHPFLSPHGTTQMAKYAKYRCP
jgi:hypothetical protein